jgi:hypothetical protein
MLGWGAKDKEHAMSQKLDSAIAVIGNRVDAWRTEVRVLVRRMSVENRLGDHIDLAWMQDSGETARFEF